MPEPFSQLRFSHYAHDVDYAEIQYHAMLLADRYRIAQYEKAIRATVKEGDVVVDLGCGSGVLGRLAAEAGASKVIMVERESRTLDLANVLNALLLPGKNFTLYLGDIESVVLDEPVNCVISELIGGMVDDEGMSSQIHNFVTNNQHILAADCRFIPELVTLQGRIFEAANSVAATDQVIDLGQFLSTGKRTKTSSPTDAVIYSNLDGLAPTSMAWMDLLDVDGRGAPEIDHHIQIPVDIETPSRNFVLVIKFDARLSKNVHLYSDGDGVQGTTWGYSVVPIDVGLRRENQQTPYELDFRLRCSSMGMEVSAELGID